MITTFSLFMSASSASSEPAAHGESVSFPPFDPTYFAGQLFWLFISFGLLLFVLMKVLLPRLGGIIEDRSHRIADDLDTAARMQREAEAAELSYEQSLKRRPCQSPQCGRNNAGQCQR